MHASRFAGLAVFVVIIVSTIVSQHANSHFVRVGGYWLAVVAALWYIIKGHNLKGWIGDSYKEMKEEVEWLEDVMANWKYSDGSPVPADKRSDILSRHRKLLVKMQYHPDKP